jgi:predicted NUDIX family phosphoesterase
MCFLGLLLFACDNPDSEKLAKVKIEIAALKVGDLLPNMEAYGLSPESMEWHWKKVEENEKFTKYRFAFWSQFSTTDAEYICVDRSDHIIAIWRGFE